MEIHHSLAFVIFLTALQSCYGVQCPMPMGNFPMIQSESCEVYWKCRGGKATAGQCMPGEQFDYMRGKCLPQKLVACIMQRKFFIQSQSQAAAAPPPPQPAAVQMPQQQPQRPIILFPFPLPRPKKPTPRPTPAPAPATQPPTPKPWPQPFPFPEPPCGAPPAPPCGGAPAGPCGAPPAPPCGGIPPPYPANPFGPPPPFQGNPFGPPPPFQGNPFGPPPPCPGGRCLPGQSRSQSLAVPQGLVSFSGNGFQNGLPPVAQRILRRVLG